MGACLVRLYRILLCLVGGFLYGLITAWVMRSQNQDPTAFFEKGYFALSWVICALPSVIYLWKYGLRASYNPDTWIETTTVYSDGTSYTTDERTTNKLIYTIIDIAIGLVFAPLVLFCLIASVSVAYYRIKGEEGAQPSFLLTPAFALLVSVAITLLPLGIYFWSGPH
jgi:hypothetical protein